MSEWILSDVRKDIDILSKQQISKENEFEEDTFFKDGLNPNYVLIDAALWGTDINMFLLDEAVIYRSLFRGTTGEELWSVAPYLVDISSQKKLIDEIKKKDTVERRVTWISSSLDIDELRKYLRRFLRVKRENGSYIYFRFYDPFVVNNVFPNFTKQQSSEFFEKIKYLITEDTRINERRIYYISSEKSLKINYQTMDYVDNNG